jgi:hypothetical protein
VPEILCVNIVDKGTSGFVRERRERRDELAADADVVELTADEARPEHVRDTIADHEATAPFSMLAYIGHGDPGILYYQHKLGLEMLTQYDSPDSLRELVRQRTIYIFACKSMTPEFAGVLLQAETSRAAGFTASPRYSDLNGRRRLADFDTYLIKALHRGDTRETILTTRDTLVEEARADRKKDWGPRYKASLTQFVTALQSFDIYES